MIFVGQALKASAYSRQIVEPLRALKPNVKVHYLMLFATTDGLDAIRGLNRFDRVEAIYELDSTFKALEPNSRIFTPIDTDFDRENPCDVQGNRNSSLGGLSARLQRWAALLRLYSQHA